MSAFPDLLRSCLATAGMSQMDLARAVGTSSSVVSQTCLGQRPPPLERMDAWADALGLQAGPREVFLATAQLAHAPEGVRERVAKLEQRLGLHEIEAEGWDGRAATARVRETGAADEGSLPLAARAIDECRALLEDSSSVVPLIDRAWEAHGVLLSLLSRAGTWPASGARGAGAVRLRASHAHLLRAAAAFRAVRPSQPAQLAAAMRKASSALLRARAALDQPPPSAAKRRPRE